MLISTTEGRDLAGTQLVPPVLGTSLFCIKFSGAVCEKAKESRGGAGEGILFTCNIGEKNSYVFKKKMHLV